MVLYEDVRLELSTRKPCENLGRDRAATLEDAAASGAASEQNADRDDERQAHWITPRGYQGHDIRPAVAARHAQTYSCPRGRIISDLDPNLGTRRMIARLGFLAFYIFPC